ncbi:MAG: prenyltransferase/squalene oxidase repeat-containing protein [Pseudomonadales bacterium]
MSGLYLSKGLFPTEYLRSTVEFIRSIQQDDGCIPWFKGGHMDPWDHVEAAMGLSIGGDYQSAELAYNWLANNQLEDGSWWAAYRDGEIDNRERRETNFVAYIATGVWHHYLITRDDEFLQRMWPVVQKAIDFVLALQTEHGDIHWAVDTDGNAMQDALITGCSSIYKSLECASNIAVTLGYESITESWLSARECLGEVLRAKPERFDRTWESKERFSMDWFYPVISGALTQAQARARIDSRWDIFVRQGMGVVCVSDEPWVTVAESCELVMALLAAGERARAVELYSWLHQWRGDDGAWWTGYQYSLNIMWPDEQPSWTAGAILLAADALTGYTPASGLLTEVNLLDSTQQGEAVGDTKIRK